MATTQRLLIILCAAAIGTVFPRTAKAGPSYDLGWKVFRADVIAEIEFVVLPKSGGWKAADAEARRSRVLRTIFQKPGVSIPAERLRTFPFSLLSKCWSEEAGKVRFLVFYSASEDLMGLENDGGGYSSLNDEYAQVVQAVSTASRWDEKRDGEIDWAPQRKILDRSRNRYLWALAARFLEQHGVEDAKLSAQRKKVIHELEPEASCGPTRR